MFNRGGFPGQRPMGHNPMNQSSMNPPSMNLPGMNMTGMNMSGMNMSGMNMPGMTMSGMGMSPMNPPNMNLSGMNHPGMNHQRMGHPGMSHQNIGLSGMNQPNMNMNLNRMTQPNMNLNRMNHPEMNQGGGMGFRPEMKNQAFGMRPMDNTGSFGGGNTDPLGMKGIPINSPMHTPSDRLMGSQVMPQRFPSPSVPLHQGPPRMPSQNQEIPSIVNRVLTHSSDPMMMNLKAPLQDPMHVMKEKLWDKGTNVYGNVAQDMGMKSVPSGPSLDKASNVQNRYTNESATSILESFGLSNEDLEELSRYPDDQLTPANMPSILRDIRLRKVVRPAPVPEQASARRPASEGVPSNVIDYGHSSKYKYSEPATSIRSYDLPRTEKKPPPVQKKSVAPTIAKPKITPEKGMDNKIPTISGSRKPVWQSSSKPDRPNNKTLVGKETTAPKTAAVTVTTVESPVITIKTDATTVPDVAPPVQTELMPAVQVVAGVGQVTYQNPAEKPAADKGSWVSVLSQEEAQKMKKLPTPSMMNDYYAASPRIFPHICSLCNVECRHLKDWIKHQNNTPHIDSCRNLRHQYPDWNPQVLSSVRNEGKKDEPPSKKSKSRSPSSQRSRRSGSRHRVRKSRSRSPRPGGRKSRSRSPRRSRKSPRRSRSPRRGARSPHRSRSPRKHKRSSRSNSPDKKAVDAAVQSFIEATKLKSGDKAKSAKASNGKKPPTKPSSSNDRSKKSASTAPAAKKPASAVPKPGSTSGSSSTKPSSSSSSSDKKPSSSSTARKPSYSSSATKKTSGSSNVKKPVISSGAKKTTTSTSSGKKPQPSKPPAKKTPPPAQKTPPPAQKTPPPAQKTPPPAQKTPPPAQKIPPAQKPPPAQNAPAASSNPMNKFTAEINSGKIIHVTDLPDSGYTDQDILKLVQPFGIVCDILIVRSKNEAFMETNFKEAAAAAVKCSKMTPVKINNKIITLSLLSKKKKPVKAAEKPAVEEPAQTARPRTEEPEQKLPEKPIHDLEVPPGFIKRYMLTDPPLQQHDKCVILISNLPETQYTVDEITNLAKPFGGVNDVLIVATHKKAYLELASRNSVDSMLKFYSVFPTYLSGNLLSICIAARYKDLKNEDLIFADLIEQASYKITPSIYETFVHLTNLPDKNLEDFEIIRVGLRFGKVEHHVFFSNKKKAIIHMHSASAAKAMHSFLSQYPCKIEENLIKCSLPPQTTLAEDEYITYIEDDKQRPTINTVKPKAPESKEPKETVVEPSVTVVKEPEDEPAPPSPVSDTEMEIDSPDIEEIDSPDIEEAEPAPPENDEVTLDTASAEVPDQPTSSSVMVATDDDGDDDEEAAEAPEAPDSSPLYVQAEPETHHQEPHSVSQPQFSEEFDVLVSVESDEEEAEELEHIPLGAEKDRETLTDEAISDDPEAEGKREGQVPKTGFVGNKDMEKASTDRGQDPSSNSSKVKETSSNVKEAKMKAADSRKEGSKSLEGKPGEEKAPKGKAEVEGSQSGQAAGTSSASMVRTTKYNARKGEISVTVTVDSQKASQKNVDSRKRTSRERGTSSYESSATKSNSSRSSPADSASSHSKSGSNFSQKKSSGKYGTSQPERDSKDPARSREREARSSSRKDDRMRSSTSSRYTRSSKSNNRSPRSKEEQEESFPFNLDEFVTVDEIVEEPIDQKEKSGDHKEDPDTARKAKRKENDSAASDPKKSRAMSGGSHELSFVTLDEVGDEEDIANQAVRSLVTLDKVTTEGGPPASAKEEQMLMTLDEISDEDEAQDPSTVQRSSLMPKTLKKGQLHTLDEVNEEGEEQTAPTKPSKVEEAKVLEEAKDAADKKEEDCFKEPEEKQQPKDQQDALASKDHPEQPLLTLDEVKAEDDEEMSFADIEHQFLTVDEIGEEEEESEIKSKEAAPKPDDKSKSSKTKESDKSKASEPTPPAKRGRPRKRPLPQTAEDKDSLQQAGTPDSKGATPSKAEAKSEGVQDGGAAASDKQEPADGKPDTEAPAKKTKVESPPAGKTKLAPYNSSTAVGLEFLVPKTGYFCELCSLFYMDDPSKLKHCKSLRHYQQVEKHLDKLQASPVGKSSST